MKKEFNDIAAALQSKFGPAITEVKADAVVDACVVVEPARAAEIGAALRSDPELSFDYLMCLSGVDYGGGKLGVVYHLYSMRFGHRLVVKTHVPADAASLPTVTGVWPSAGWHEREAYDLYGIVFEGHPDLRRILLPDDYPGWPLRKDFKVPEFYNGMKVPY
jgi:NADH-quinone oxidoreductase subunit C